jgi:hypothetical protein
VRIDLKWKIASWNRKRSSDPTCVFLAMDAPASISRQTLRRFRTRSSIWTRRHPRRRACISGPRRSVERRHVHVTSRRDWMFVKLFAHDASLSHLEHTYDVGHPLSRTTSPAAKPAMSRAPRRKTLSARPDSISMYTSAYSDKAHAFVAVEALPH